MSGGGIGKQAAADMHRLIEKYEGIPFVSPSMREVPIDQNRSAIDFAYRLITGQIGVVILTTGVGFRYLVKAIEPHLDKQRFLDALSDVITICRGPKPVAAMRELGLSPTHRVLSQTLGENCFKPLTQKFKFQIRWWDCRSTA